MCLTFKKLAGGPDTSLVLPDGRALDGTKKLRMLSGILAHRAAHLATVRVPDCGPLRFVWVNCTLSQRHSQSDYIF
jgi:hypothetical protein